jgi:aspartyl/glutamyl-tRNA(Asn/Gln) amidotransferase C subunit
LDFEKELDRILELVRIEIEPDKKNDFVLNFKKMVEFFKKIDGLNLEDEEPFIFIEHLRTYLRDDFVKEFAFKSKLFNNAPLVKDRFFVTKSPIE